MDRDSPHPVKDSTTLVGPAEFSLDRLLSHTDPAPAVESEAFVRFIYEQRHLDISSGGNHETRS
jgi:hypothetical protein